MSQRRSKNAIRKERGAVVIDGRTGNVIGEAMPVKRGRKAKPRELPPELSPTVIDDVALGLGLVEAIFDSADHIARIMRRGR